LSSDLKKDSILTTEKNLSLAKNYNYSGYDQKQESYFGSYGLNNFICNI
jgi:hypothetical protein